MTVGTKPRRNVHTYGAGLAARTKVFTAKPISRALGLLWIIGDATFRVREEIIIFLKTTTRSTHIQVRYYLFIYTHTQNQN